MSGKTIASGSEATTGTVWSKFKALIGVSWFGALVAALLLWLLAGSVAGGVSLEFLLANATIAGFLAVAGGAQMTVIASGPGNFDLSLPYVVTFGAYVMSAGFLGDGNIVGSLVLTLAVGAAVGALNAALVLLLRIPAIVATLATGYIIYSLSISIQSVGFHRIGGTFEALLRSRDLGVPGVLFVCILTLVGLGIVLKWTVYGQQLHALGQNAEAARLAGVRRGRVLLITFMISGALAAWLGVLLVAYQGGTSADLGRSYLLGSVAAVVVGGTSISGGTTSIVGTALGALVISLALTDLTLLKFSVGSQYVAQGLIVVGTVCLATVRRQNRR